MNDKELLAIIQGIACGVISGAMERADRDGIFLTANVVRVVCLAAGSAALGSAVQILAIDNPKRLEALSLEVGKMVTEIAHMQICGEGAKS